jgi:hypothetical protein
MRLMLVRCSTPEPSTRAPCLVDFIITTSELRFSVYTAAGPDGGEMLASTTMRLPTSGGAPLLSDNAAAPASSRPAAAALEPHRLEYDAHDLGQPLDVGDAAFDVDIERGPTERRCGKARDAPGDQAKTHGSGDQADRHAAAEAVGWREEHQGGQRRPRP